MGMSYWTDDKFTLEGFIEEYATDTTEMLRVFCARVDPMDQNAIQIRTGFTVLMLLRMDRDMCGLPRDIHQAAKRALDDEAYGSKDLRAMYDYIG